MVCYSPETSNSQGLVVVGIKLRYFYCANLGYGLTNVGTEIVSDWTCLFFFVIYLLIYW